MKVANPSLWPVEDQRAWAQAFRFDDPFDDRGPAAHWAERSRKTVASGYGRWIAWLMEDESDALTITPADRITPERMRRFIAVLESEITPNGVANYVKHTYDAIRVMAPDRDWSWLLRVKANLERKRTPKRKRAHTPDPWALLGLGLKLMDGVDLERLTYRDALAYRDGLMIAFLTLVPLRRRNLAGLRIGKNLVRAGATYVVTFEPSETKKGQSLEFAWPDILRPYLDTFLNVVRPSFPEANRHVGLWPSWKGCPLGEQQAYVRVCRHTQEGLGFAVSPHRFRDAAATNLAINDPANVLVARDLLGHASFTGTRKTYIIAKSAEASRHLAGAVSAMRGRLAVAERHGDLKG